MIEQEIEENLVFDVKGKGWFWKNKKQNIDNTNSEKEPSEKTIYNLLGTLYKFRKVYSSFTNKKKQICYIHAYIFRYFEDNRKQEV